MSEEAMWSNGINGSTGEYLSPLTDEEIVAMVKGRVINEEDLQATLVSRDSAQSEEFLGPKAGINANLIAEAGWGVIFAQSDKDRLPDLKEGSSPCYNCVRARPRFTMNLTMMRRGGGLAIPTAWRRWRTSRFRRRISFWPKMARCPATPRIQKRCPTIC
ncbi:MAG: hypothetical protein R2932_59375 [Caldilineaceae bacterium]